MFGGHLSTASGDIIKCLIYHVTSEKQVIETLSNLINGHSSWYVTTLTGLVVIGAVEVEM